MKHTALPAAAFNSPEKSATATSSGRRPAFSEKSMPPGQRQARGGVLRAAVNGLKSIHECYELMRTLYAQGVFLGKQGKRDDAEVSLLEARQLAKKLELDYYQAFVAVALVDALAPQERFS